MVTGLSVSTSTPPASRETGGDGRRKGDKRRMKMRSPFDWVVSEKDFPIEDDRFCRFCGRRLEYRDSLYCMCLPDDYDYRRHPDSCGADAANEPEEELTELEGDALWSQD